MLLHNKRSARGLCAVICWLYPKARPGIDFVIDCEAPDRWPRIREWRLKAPCPSEGDIKQAMTALQEALHDETTQSTIFREIGAAGESSSAHVSEVFRTRGPAARLAAPLKSTRQT